MQYHSLSALFFQSVWRERGERVGLCVWDEGGVGKMVERPDLDCWLA